MVYPWGVSPQLLVQEFAGWNLDLDLELPEGPGWVEGWGWGINDRMMTT